MTHTDSAGEWRLWNLTITWVLLIPLLFLAAQGAPSIDRAEYNVQTDSGAGTIRPNSDSAQKHIEQLIVYSILSIVLVAYSPRYAPVLKRNIILLLLPLLALISSAWSQAPLITVETSAASMIVLLLGVYLTLRFTPERQMELFLATGIAFIVLSIAFVVLCPSIGVDQAYGHGEWQGICNHKNKFATAMVYLLMPACFVRVTSRFRRGVIVMYMLCATLGVVMSRARTGWLLLIVALSVAGFMKWQAQFPKRERVILAASFVMASVLMIVSTVGYYAQIALLLGKDSTLTGRTDVYKAILIEVVREPIWGYGYMAFFIGRGEWLNFALRSRFIGLGNAENPLLQVWLELGLIGVACLLVSLFQACRNAGLCLVNNPSGYTQWCIMMIFLNVAALLGGDKIMFPHTIEWLLYVIGYIGLSTEAQRIRNRAHEINSR